MFLSFGLGPLWTPSWLVLILDSTKGVLTTALCFWAAPVGTLGAAKKKRRAPQGKQTQRLKKPNLTSRCGGQSRKPAIRQEDAQRRWAKMEERLIAAVMSFPELYNFATVHERVQRRESLYSRLPLYRSHHDIAKMGHEVTLPHLCTTRR